MLEEYGMTRQLLNRLNGTESSLHFWKVFNDGILETKFIFPLEIHCAPQGQSFEDKTVQLSIDTIMYR